jgi:hypothetical protein
MPNPEVLQGHRFKNNTWIAMMTDVLLVPSSIAFLHPWYSKTKVHTLVEKGPLIPVCNGL